MKYAVIEEGIVSNIIVWDGLTALNLAYDLVLIGNDHVNIGYTYADGVFSPPVEIIE